MREAEAVSGPRRNNAKLWPYCEEEPRGRGRRAAMVGYLENSRPNILSREENRPFSFLLNIPWEENGSLPKENANHH